MSDDSNEDGFEAPVVKRTIKAKGAAPVHTTAPNSVFALGGISSPKPAKVLKTAPTSPGTPFKRTVIDPASIVKEIEARREMTFKQILAFLDCASSAAHRHVSKLVDEGRIHESRRLAGVKFYAVSRRAPAAEPDESLAPADANSGAGELLCGLLNTGGLLIEEGRQSVRLSKMAARELFTYLTQNAAALNAA